MILILQILIYLILFTAAIKAVVWDDPVNGIFFYPKTVQRRVFEMELTTPKIARKRKAIFFTFLLIGVVALPILFIGVWNGITDFRTAYFQALILLETMNWYDGIVVDSIWVRYSKFWIISGTEDLSYVKSVKTVLLERSIMSIVYLPVAALIAWLAVLIGNIA